MSERVWMGLGGAVFPVAAVRACWGANLWSVARGSFLPPKQELP
jgi:hypothetical protein